MSEYISSAPTASRYRLMPDGHTTTTNLFIITLFFFESTKKFGPFLDLCMSSFGRGHANLLYIVSILSDVLEGTPSLFSHFLFFSSSSDQHQHQLMRFTWKQNLRYYIGFLETLASGARKEAAKARTNPGLVVISRFGVAGFVNSNVAIE